MGEGIVVGVDGSEASAAALRWAHAEAKVRDRPLVVVAAWQLPYFSIPAGTVWTATLDVEEPARSAAATVREMVAALGETDVTIESRVVESSPARALLDAAAEAELLVVGRRGRGDFSALILGSVSTQCAHHSPCPVVIVPGEGQDQGMQRR